MVHPFLRPYPALRTPPLPVTRVGIGDRRVDTRLMAAFLLPHSHGATSCRTRYARIRPVLDRICCTLHGTSSTANHVLFALTCERLSMQRRPHPINAPRVPSQQHIAPSNARWAPISCMTLFHINRSHTEPDHRTQRNPEAGSPWLSIYTMRIGLATTNRGNPR